MVFTVFSGCFFEKKSDEDLIRDRINAFLKAYNSGDISAVLDCMDAKTRNEYSAIVNIGSALLGKSGLGGVSVSDLFALGVGGMSEGDILSVSNEEIELIDSQNARVNVEMSYKDKVSQMNSGAVFTMVKEGDDWFIKDFKEK